MTAHATPVDLLDAGERVVGIVGMVWDRETGDCKHIRDPKGLIQEVGHPSILHFPQDVKVWGWLGMASQPTGPPSVPEIGAEVGIDRPNGPRVWGKITFVEALPTEVNVLMDIALPGRRKR